MYSKLCKKCNELVEAQGKEELRKAVEAHGKACKGFTYLVRNKIDPRKLGLQVPPGHDVSVDAEGRISVTPPKNESSELSLADAHQ